MLYNKLLFQKSDRKYCTKRLNQNVLNIHADSLVTIIELLCFLNVTGITNQRLKLIGQFQHAKINDKSFPLCTNEHTGGLTLITENLRV